MKYLVLLLALLLLPGALAASISGIVYDLGLKPMTTAIVSVDTAQPQRMVTYGDGSYAFKVPAGTYVLSANATDDGTRMYAQETITVGDDGEYKIDLILAPVLTPPDDESAAPVVTPESPGFPYAGLGIGLMLLGVLAGGGYFYLRRRQREPVQQKDEFRSAVIRALKTYNGRATQKDIRKNVHFSEAKVSLVLTELEDEGTVKKIKKGRGNVIVLK